MAKDSDLVRILVVNGHRTSAGTCPGVFEIPLAEASSIAERRYGRVLQPDEQPAGLGKTRRPTHGVSN